MSAFNEVIIVIPANDCASFFTIVFHTFPSIDFKILAGMHR